MTKRTYLKHQTVIREKQSSIQQSLSVIREYEPEKLSSGSQDVGFEPTTQSSDGFDNNHSTVQDGVKKSDYEFNIAGQKALISSNLTHSKATTLVPKKKTLVLDLDETLIHSSFELTNQRISSFTIPLTQEDGEKIVYVNKRPYVDEFLELMSKMYEIVIFTAGLKSYADPVIDALDVNRVCKKRLFRDSCIFWNGYYIKDLAILKRSKRDVIIIDNSPCCYCLNPQNAIPIGSWFDDESDNELMELVPLLTTLAQVEDVTNIIDSVFDNDVGLTKKTIDAIRSNQILALESDC